jgi:predicted membrane chloride channel (bestrophin family)
VTGTLDKIAESTFSRFTSRIAIMVVPFLMLAIVWFVQHEIGILESNHTEEVASRASHEKTMWDQIGKITATQNDTALKLSNVGTQFADHQKDDDKFSATVAESLKGIAAQIRDITVSSARVAPTPAPAAAPPAVPATVPKP